LPETQPGNHIKPAHTIAFRAGVYDEYSERKTVDFISFHMIKYALCKNHDIHGGIQLKSKGGQYLVWSVPVDLKLRQSLPNRTDTHSILTEETKDETDT